MSRANMNSTFAVFEKVGTTIVEVERAQKFWARAEPELSKLSSVEPEPDIVGLRAYFEPWPND